MGGEALRAWIEAEGRARVATVLQDAERRAERLRSDARAEAERRRQRLLALEENRLRAEGNLRLAAARAEAQSRVLAARDALLERVFARSRQLLAASLRTAAGEARMVERARQALAYIPEGEVRIVCSTGLAPILERALADRSGLRVECDSELPAGLRAVGRNGALEVDATLEHLLDLSRPQLAIELLRRIDAQAPS